MPTSAKLFELHVIASFFAWDRYTTFKFLWAARHVFEINLTSAKLCLKLLLLLLGYQHRFAISIVSDNLSKLDWLGTLIITEDRRKDIEFYTINNQTFQNDKIPGIRSRVLYFGCWCRVGGWRIVRSFSSKLNKSFCCSNLFIRLGISMAESFIWPFELCRSNSSVTWFNDDWRPKLYKTSRVSYMPCNESTIQTNALVYCSTLG